MAFFNEKIKTKYKKVLIGNFRRIRKILIPAYRFASWSQEEFMESLQEINRLSCKLVAETRSQLLFSILPGKLKNLL